MGNDLWKAREVARSIGMNVASESLRGMMIGLVVAVMTLVGYKAWQLWTKRDNPG